MKIIIADKKTSFTDKQISLLKEKGNVVFIETKEDWNKSKEIFSEEEKVLALDPGVCDWSFPNEIIDKVPNLKGICLPTTRFTWVDGEYLRKKNIVLTNVPKYSTESVAEHAIFLMLSITKKLPLIISNGWKLDWEKHLGYEIKDKRMGIIGLGDIGSRVAELGKGMGMDVCYWSRKSRDEKYTYLELEELIKSSDYIFLTIADGPETKEFMNKERIDMMKKNSYIINTTGNEVWDFNYAVEKVKDESIGGIGLDEDKIEMKDYGCNVMITPHIAWYTKESFVEDYRIWVECIISVVDNKPINAAN